MPNWCNNSINISGSTETIKTLWDEANKEGSGLLNAMKPMPKELEGTTSPSPREGTPQPLVDGYDNWYSWRVDNWGTKWEVGEVDYYDADDDGYVQWEFCTAWGPPEGACEKLRELFPDVSISWFYDEPGCELAGYL